MYQYIIKMVWFAFLCVGLVSEFGVHVIYLKTWYNTKCHSAMAMPKNISDLYAYTWNTTSMDLCSWMAVCDWPYLMIRTNWTVTTLWCNKPPTTPSCILNCISSYWRMLMET